MPIVVVVMMNRISKTNAIKQRAYNLTIVNANLVQFCVDPFDGRLNWRPRQNIQAAKKKKKMVAAQFISYGQCNNV